MGAVIIRSASSAPSARPVRMAGIFRMCPPKISRGRLLYHRMLTRRAVFSLLLAPLAPVQSPRLPQPGVRYVPTPQNVVDAMLALARVTSADIVYDLGSGDGRFLI